MNDAGAHLDDLHQSSAPSPGIPPGISPGASAEAAPGADGGAHEADDESPLTPTAELTRRIDLVLSAVDRLPTLSPIASRLLRLSSAADADFRQITAMIESDPTLTARILGLCRRSDRAVHEEVTSVDRAVVLLGFEAVRAAMLSVEVFDLLGDSKRAEPSAGAHAFDRHAFWRYSIGVASAAELLAQEIRRADMPRPAEAFTCGLVHGLGLIALDYAIPRTLARVVDIAERRRRSLAETLRLSVGIDQHTAGRRLAERWGLPRSLHEVMWLHGLPRDAMPQTPTRRTVELVNVAIAIARRLHIGWCCDFNQPPNPATLASRLGASSRVVEKVMEGVHERVVQRAETLGLDEHPSDRLLLESVFAANHELDRMRGALDDQTADADALARAVRAVATLHDRSGEIEQRGEERLAMRVALSAKIALASPRVVVMHQLPDDEGWRIGSASDTERPASRFISVEDAPANLSTLIHGLRPNAPLAAIPELRATLDGFDDPMGAFVVPLTGRVLTGVVVYLCAGASPAAPSVIEALRLAWTEALDAEGGRTLASRMNEQLADANRRLAEAQSRLVETESLSRLAEVAAGAAHEMNNPLTIITGRSQMLAQAATNDQQRAFAQAIEVSARKLTDLVTSLRLYADPPQPKPSPLSLRDVLDRALRAALERARLVPGRERPDVRIIVEGPIPTFTLDGGQVTEAVTELITNALESEGCSVVEVRARRQTPEEAGAPDADAPEALVIAVTDNGSGMSERALRHACDPFFSEKRAGRQQGLGLARASRLAGLNGGEIRLQNLESGGLNASLVFPPAPSLLFHNAQQQSAA